MLGLGSSEGSGRSISQLSAVIRVVIVDLRAMARGGFLMLNASRPQSVLNLTPVTGAATGKPRRGRGE